ncbi:MAG: stage V sporulation protein AD [Clostridia bacterium]|nr:stage V sporulation protein AD [Clostridia bacterium]
MYMAKTGSRSFELASKPRIVSSASYVGKKEGEGPLGDRFDVIMKDDTLGLKSWEKAESRMFESAVRVALSKVERTSEDLDCLIGGDLLDQIVSAGFAAREIRSPFIGLYSACSTITEALMIGGMLMDGGFIDLAACAGSSHFSSVERQYRFPLEMGVQPVPTAQRTVTGAGCMLLSREAIGENKQKCFQNIIVSAGTMGSVEDFGITDAGNMGAAMAPAAADTIAKHLADFGRSPCDYDRIITGDLGVFGSDMLFELLEKRGIGIRSVHNDCGKLIFGDDKSVVCGGSGCGCAAVTLASHYLPLIESGKLKRILILATGALLSPVTSMQGESIPAIAHAVVIEHRSNGGSER